MIKVNKVPSLTSVNYGINDYEINEEILNKEITSFNSFNIENLELKDINEIINTKYGLGKEVLNQINTNSNFKKELEINKKSLITLELNENNKNLIDYLKIRIKKNTEVDLIINYKSKDTLEYYHNGLIKILLERNAKAKVTLINEINENSTNLISIDNELQDNSKLDFIIVDFGGKLSISNYFSNLGKYAENNLHSIFLGTKSSELDINYIIEMTKESGVASMEVEGALTANAKKNFKGTINFIKGCKKSKGAESENTLLLSKTARSKSLPMLLASEENVEGSHSVGTGKVNKKELFYLMSRGISEKDAKKVLVRARFNKTLEMINNEEIKNEILKIIDERIE